VCLYMDAREVDSNAVPFSGPLPRSNLNQKLALRLALRMGALHHPPRVRMTPSFLAIRNMELFAGKENYRSVTKTFLLGQRNPNLSRLRAGLRRPTGGGRYDLKCGLSKAK